jgi:hypothetical protein
MSNNQDIPKKIGEIERYISDGEGLLRKTSNDRTASWIAIGISGLTLLFGNNSFLGLLAVCVIIYSAFRLYYLTKSNKEIEDGLREYRARKAELTAILMAGNKNS